MNRPRPTQAWQSGLACVLYVLFWVVVSCNLAGCTTPDEVQVRVVQTVRRQTRRRGSPSQRVFLSIVRLRSRTEPQDLIGADAGACDDFSGLGDVERMQARGVDEA